MNFILIPNNDELKKLKLEGITFNVVSLKDVPAPYVKNYSGHSDSAYRNYKTFDRFGFRDELLKNLSASLNDTVVKIILTPPSTNTFYNAFAYLANKEIVGLQFK